MSGEIRDWLADLRGSDPPAAVQVGQALIALISEGPSLGPPLVITLAGFPGAPDLPRELDGLYQSRLEQMGDMRQHLAEAATLVRDIEHQGAETPDEEAEARLRETAGQIERELGLAASADGLMELRPGAPGDSDIRILFAVEPPGTALLIAVLEGRDAMREHRSEAVGLSAEVLQRVPEGPAPEATEHAFDDAHSFLARFFPGSADDVEVGAAALAARNRARTLAEQRTRLRLTQAQVAQRMGVRQERISAIERAEPGATEVRTLAGYVER